MKNQEAQRNRIDATKSRIRRSRGKWFEAGGYAGRIAIRELREAGHRIEYNKEDDQYRICQKGDRR